MSRGFGEGMSAAPCATHVLAQILPFSTGAAVTDWWLCFDKCDDITFHFVENLEPEQLILQDSPICPQTHRSIRLAPRHSPKDSHHQLFSTLSTSTN